MRCVLFDRSSQIKWAKRVRATTTREKKGSNETENPYRLKFSIESKLAAAPTNRLLLYRKWTQKNNHQKCDCTFRTLFTLAADQQRSSVTIKMFTFHATLSLLFEVKFAIYLYSTIRVGWLNRHHTQRRRVCANEMDGIWREGSSSTEGATESATGKELAQPTTTSPYQFVGFVCIVCASFRNHLTNMWSFAISSCIIFIIIITIIVMVCFFSPNPIY